jgi:hypothetical protein
VPASGRRITSETDDAAIVPGGRLHADRRRWSKARPHSHCGDRADGRHAVRFQSIRLRASLLLTAPACSTSREKPSVKTVRRSTRLCRSRGLPTTAVTVCGLAASPTGTVMLSSGITDGRRDIGSCRCVAATVHRERAWGDSWSVDSRWPFGCVSALTSSNIWVSRWPVVLLADPVRRPPYRCLCLVARRQAASHLTRDRHERHRPPQSVR